MNLKRTNNRSIFRLAANFFLLLTVAVIAGCSRYAPVPVPPPQYKIIEIDLKTAENRTDEFYYYIVFDLSEDANSRGPRPILSGEDIADNWDYYIRLKSEQLTEKYINNEDDIYEEPDIFDSTNERYYSVPKTSNSFTLMLFYDKITSVDFVRVNFITSRQPLTDDPQAAIQAVDYLDEKISFTIPADVGTIVRHTDHPDINNTVTDDEDKPGDFTEWTINIYEI